MSVHIDHTPSRLQEQLRIALPEISEERERALVRAYCEQWRTYHNFHHIWKMIHVAETVFRDQCTERQWRMLLVMILYHDVVYKVGVRAPENEIASAQWAAHDMTTCNTNKDFKWCVHHGIKATKTHTLIDIKPSHQRIVAMLLDLDLFGLGGATDAFAADTELIWHEYQPVMHRGQYDTGRCEWAKTFLTRPVIFQTPQLGHLESSARANLKRLAGI